MPDDLVTILDKIVTGVASRYGYWDELDDRRQDFFLLVMRKTEGNVFSYLTTVAVNCLRQSSRRKPLVLIDDVEELDALNHARFEPRRRGIMG
jgi:hypothetical protein